VVPVENAPVEPPEPAAPPAAPAPAVETSPAGTNARLDQIEEVARIALRKTEILGENAAKRPPEDSAVVVNDRGFVLKRSDGSSALRVGALLQADGRFFFRDDALEANDTFLIRRFRPYLDGTLFSLVDYRLLVEFAGTVQILDAYADVHPRIWLRVRVGKFKGPIGLERLQSDGDLPLLERALDQNLSSMREVGAQLWGDVAAVAQYSFGIVDGAPDGTSPDTDTNHAKDFVGRIFFQPFRGQNVIDLGNLGIGFAASVGDRKGRLPNSTTAAVTGLPVFKTAGQNTFFQYFAPATDTTGATTTFAHEAESHFNPQLYYYYQGFGVLADYVLLRQGVQRGNATVTLNHQSTHATLNYVLGGRAGFDGVTPTAAFDPKAGTWGAFEIVARWAWLKVDSATFGDPNVPGSTQYADPTKSARSAEAWTGGITWVPARTFHVALDFEQTQFKGGAGTTAAPADRKTENVLIARVQLNF
jgi:phosphate-selective porin OprO/OprP